MSYTLEQAQLEASLITGQLTAPGQESGVFTKEEYDSAEAVVGTQIIAFPRIINNLVMLFDRLDR